jgi:hypothetical protein
LPKIDTLLTGTLLLLIASGYAKFQLLKLLIAPGYTRISHSSRIYQNFNSSNLSQTVKR